MKKFLDGQEVIKSCPECGPATKLVMRTNRKTGKRFLSCPNWPRCGHSENVPEAIKMEMSGQPRLL